MVELDLMEALWVRVISLFSSALLEDNTECDALSAKVSKVTNK